MCSYKQALSSAVAARALCNKHGIAFSRPNDYYAEMVKSDSHMERIRQKLLDESFVSFLSSPLI
jgi:rRNA-processing protein EBP2